MRSEIVGEIVRSTVNKRRSNVQMLRHQQNQSKTVHVQWKNGLKFSVIWQHGHVITHMRELLDLAI